MASPEKRPIWKSNPSHTGDNRAATPVASWAMTKNDDDDQKGTMDSNHQHQVPETCVLPIELLPQTDVPLERPKTRRLNAIAVACGRRRLQSTPPSSLSISPVQYT